MIRIYHAFAARLDDAGDWALPTLARLVFAGVFLIYFIASAGLKFEGSILSPSAGGFGQIFPKAAEAVLWDVTQMSLFQRLVIIAGTVAEYVLPVLIVIGLLTRFAALGMVGFILVQTFVDVTGHGVELGAWFNSGAPDLFDQRSLWVMLLLILVFKGAGPASADSALRPRRAA